MFACGTKWCKNKFLLIYTGNKLIRVATHTLSSHIPHINSWNISSIVICTSYMQNHHLRSVTQMLAVFHILYIKLFLSKSCSFRYFSSSNKTQWPSLLVCFLGVLQISPSRLSQLESSFQVASTYSFHPSSQYTVAVK